MKTKTRQPQAYVLPLLLGMLSFLSGAPAHALIIVLRDVGATPMSAAQLVAFNRAAGVWENAFSDPVTIYLNVAWEPAAYFTRPGVLASTQSARTTLPYASVALAMILDRNLSEAEETRFLASGLLPGIPTVRDINGTRLANRITLSTANAKALGVTTYLDPVYGAPLDFGADADLRFNQFFQFQWDLNPDDGIGPGLYDFVGAAAHEIGHALGFGSSLDSQDANPGMILYPSALDLLRFDSPLLTPGVPAASDPRPLTAGPAMFCDAIGLPCSAPAVAVNGFSSGTNAMDPNCNTASRRCQASHWSDATLYLMDPTAATGELKVPQYWDIATLGIIGWDITPLRMDIRAVVPSLLQEGRISWTTVGGLPNTPPPLPGYPPAPAPPTDPGGSSIAFVANLDFGFSKATNEPVLGGKRTLTAVATFAPAMLPAVQDPFPGIIPDVDQWEAIEPPRPPMQVTAPALCGLALNADTQNGVPMQGSLIGDCAPFDPAEGANGGWRLPICLDGLGDNQQGDCDARMVIHLQLEQAIQVVSLQNLIGKAMKLADTLDNSVALADAGAVGMSDADADGVWQELDNCTQVGNPTQLDSNGDGYGNICDADLNETGLVTANDFSLLRSVLNQPSTASPLAAAADMNGSGLVTATDFNLLRARLNTAPGPSGLH